MPSTVVTSDLARRFEQVWARFQSPRMGGILQVPVTRPEARALGERATRNK